VRKLLSFTNRTAPGQAHAGLVVSALSWHRVVNVGGMILNAANMEHCGGMSVLVIFA